MKKHPDKHIRKAVEYAIESGWIFEASGGHAFGRLRCGNAEHRDHTMSVWSTPKSPESHAKQIMRMVRKCTP